MPLPLCPGRNDRSSPSLRKVCTPWIWDDSVFGGHFMMFLLALSEKVPTYPMWTVLTTHSCLIFGRNVHSSTWSLIFLSCADAIGGGGLIVCGIFSSGTGDREWPGRTFLSMVSKGSLG